MKFKLNKKQTFIAIIVILVITIILTFFFSVKNSYEPFDLANCNDRNNVHKKPANNWKDQNTNANVINTSNYKTYANNYMKIDMTNPVINFLKNTDSTPWTIYFNYSANNGNLIFIDSSGILSISQPLVTNYDYQITVTPNKSPTDLNIQNISKGDDGSVGLIPCSYKETTLNCNTIENALNDIKKSKPNTNKKYDWDGTYKSGNSSYPAINNWNYFKYANNFAITQSPSVVIYFKGNTDSKPWTTYLIYQGYNSNIATNGILYYFDSAGNNKPNYQFSLKYNSIYKISVTPNSVLASTDFTVTEIGQYPKNYKNIIPCTTTGISKGGVSSASTDATTSASSGAASSGSASSGAASSGSASTGATSSGSSSSGSSSSGSASSGGISSNVISSSSIGNKGVISGGSKVGAAKSGGVKSQPKGGKK